ncbi:MULTISPECIES: TetR/AcrR family transcriptional regulator [unclassified Nocardioides]|uniref:TetR/AcrR family transcriptional regulator n=1 Tax=unclassified Nocardioides TaxID=2615069 RepID=UPI0006F8FBFB|nr:MULTISPECIES: TetR/AcrR family transcriptional regulator [unclassified Nocardioides]KQY57470.1 TetR family transcriptional regulator [Nocardioides sp. Root140]KQZ76162.1 TetR family transcriptional regulator [Nocardioides sp. Root151]KRF20333.1 TetR family transcriptional regulator [Nocardioides sp. Soil796]
MASVTDLDDEPVTTRDRIVDKAAELTTQHGWAWVTMSKLADAAGVSRQTVYNEIGTKPALAEAMILGELARFLDLVNRAFDENPTDLVAAIRGASQAVLEFAEGNPLLHAVVSATHGADTELLPLLTTHSQSLLGVAKLVVHERVEPFEIAISPARLEAAIDMVVRVVLSHVMQPSATPAETADDVSWIAERVLRP